MKFLAIDPGDKMSGYVFFNNEDPRLISGGFGKVSNTEMMSLVDRELTSSITENRDPVIVCEYPQPRGQMASYQLFDTVEFIGMIHHHGVSFGGPRFKFHKVDRRKVKDYICAGVRHPNDGQVRQALIDRYGGEKVIKGPKCQACNGKGGVGRGKLREVCSVCNGTKETETGMFHGVVGDVWQALAMAIFYESAREEIQRL